MKLLFIFRQNIMYFYLTCSVSSSGSVSAIVPISTAPWGKPAFIYGRVHENKGRCFFFIIKSFLSNLCPVQQYCGLLPHPRPVLAGGEVQSLHADARALILLLAILLLFRLFVLLLLLPLLLLLALLLLLLLRLPGLLLDPPGLLLRRPLRLCVDELALVVLAQDQGFESGSGLGEFLA